MSISDTQTPKPSRGLTRKKNSSLQNAAILKLLLSCIAETPRSKKQIAEITGLNRTTAERWLNVMAVRKGGIKNLVYIAEWGKAGSRGHPVALWKLGYGMLDVPKPKAKPQKQLNKEWRLRQKRKPSVTQTVKGIIHVAR